MRFTFPRSPWTPALVIAGVVCLGLVQACALDPPSSQFADTLARGASPSDDVNQVIDPRLEDIEETAVPADVQQGPSVVPEPDLQLSDYAVTVWTDPLINDGIDWVGTDHSSSVLVANANDLWRIDGDEVVPISLGGKLDPGEIVASATLPGHETLVASVDEIVLVDEDSLATWSSSNALSGLTFSDLAAEGTEEEPVLWIAASNGLHRWSKTGVDKVIPQGVGAKNAQIASCGDVLWVAAEGDVYPLEQMDGSWVAGVVEREETDATHVACDEGGRVWLVDSDGVSYRSSDGTWRDLPDALPATRAWTQRTSRDAWLRSSEGLWLVNGSSVRPVETSLTAHVAAADGEGRLWVGGPTGLARLSPGRSVGLMNWPVDDMIGGPLSLALELETPDKVLDIAATVGNHTLIVVEDPWSIELNPGTYGEGSHTLNITVDYVDTELSSSLSLPFTVVLVSWDEDIEPIATPRCATCHGAEGSSGLKLFNAAQWKTYHSMIVPVVQSGVMPPGGNLSADEVLLIKLWGNAGFP